MQLPSILPPHHIPLTLPLNKCLSPSTPSSPEPLLSSFDPTMPLSRSTRLAALILANILIPLAVLVFATGFFPYKPFLPGLASFEDERSLGGMGGERPRAVFDRVVFMVVDALRSDFVFGEGSGFGFVQRLVSPSHERIGGVFTDDWTCVCSLVRSGAAIPFTAHATPPTVTMPRVKALTTGSVPSFLDLILNFAESDTSSSLAGQDTWLAQIKAKTGVTGGKGRIVFYGDDTWLKLFPSGAAGISSEAGGAGAPFFARADGTTSFFVSVSRTDPGNPRVAKDPIKLSTSLFRDV